MNPSTPIPRIPLPIHFGDQIKKNDHDSSDLDSPEKNKKKLTRTFSGRTLKAVRVRVTKSPRKSREFKIKSTSCENRPPTPKLSKHSDSLVYKSDELNRIILAFSNDSHARSDETPTAKRIGIRGKPSKNTKKVHRIHVHSISPIERNTVTFNKLTRTFTFFSSCTEHENDFFDGSQEVLDYKNLLKENRKEFIADLLHSETKFNCYPEDEDITTEEAKTIKVFECFWSTFSRSGKNKFIKDLFSAAASIEPSDTFMRADNTYVRGFNTYQKRHLYDYLSNSIGPIIKKVKQMNEKRLSEYKNFLNEEKKRNPSLEHKNSKNSKLKKIKKIENTQITLVNKLLINMADQMEKKFPSDVKNIYQHMYGVMIKKNGFSEIHSKNLIANFLFLRVICPTLIHPAKFGLKLDLTSLQLTVIMKNLSKILQAEINKSEDCKKAGIEFAFKNDLMRKTRNEMINKLINTLVE